MLKTGGCLRVVCSEFKDAAARHDWHIQCPCNLHAISGVTALGSGALCTSEAAAVTNYALCGMSAELQQCNMNPLAVYNHTISETSTRVVFKELPASRGT